MIQIVICLFFTGYLGLLVTLCNLSILQDYGNEDTKEYEETKIGFIISSIILIIGIILGIIEIYIN